MSTSTPKTILAQLGATPWTFIVSTTPIVLYIALYIHWTTRAALLNCPRSMMIPPISSLLFYAEDLLHIYSMMFFLAFSAYNLGTDDKENLFHVSMLLAASLLYVIFCSFNVSLPFAILAIIGFTIIPFRWKRLFDKAIAEMATEMRNGTNKQSRSIILTAFGIWLLIFTVFGASAASRYLLFKRQLHDIVYINNEPKYIAFESESRMTVCDIEMRFGVLDGRYYSIDVKDGSTLQLGSYSGKLQLYSDLPPSLQSYLSSWYNGLYPEPVPATQPASALG